MKFLPQVGENASQVGNQLDDGQNVRLDPAPAPSELHFSSSLVNSAAGFPVGFTYRPCFDFFT